MTQPTPSVVFDAPVAPERKRAIARRLYAQGLVLAIAITVLFTGIQAWMGYRERVRDLHATLAQIRSIHAESITAAMWSFNDAQLTVSAKGILQLPHVQYVAIRGIYGQWAGSYRQHVEVGARKKSGVIEEKTVLVHDPHGRPEPIGVLLVQADTTTILRDVLWLALTSFLMLGSAICVVVSALFLLFQRQVIRHLGKAAEYFNGFDFKADPSPLRLDKKRRNDELDILVDHSNRMIQSLVEASLRQEAAMQSLQEGEARLNLATRAANIGIWDWDVVANRLVWADNMYALYGITPESFTGTHEAWVRRLHPADAQRAQGEIRDALAGHKEFATHFRILRPDGVVRHICSESRTLRDESGRAVRMIGANWDITALRQAEEANQSKGASLAAMGHEIRTPVNAVIDAIGAVLESPLGDDQRARLEAAGASARRLLSVIDDLKPVGQAAPLAEQAKVPGKEGV